MKNDINRLFVNSKSSIIDTLKIININTKGMAIVVDNSNKLLGTITDGDIRRGIIKGISLNESIENIYNKHCKYCFSFHERSEIKNLFEEFNLKIIPVINNDRVVVDYFEIKDIFFDENINKENYVLIMAGGLGTRLKPLTNDIPKPMLNVGGRPILETIINQFKKKGFTNILISVNYKSEIIENYFRDGKDFGVSINYIKEEKRMGTAGAVKLAERFLKAPFFVINGDILTNVNFEDFLDYHMENKFSMTIGSRSYEMQVPYGVLNMNDICVTSLQEKPILSFNVSGGIYVLNPEVVKHIPQDEYFDITELINILINNEVKTGSFPIQEYWMDIGRLEDYNKANEDARLIF